MIKLLNTLDGEKSINDILLTTGFSAAKVGKVIVELYKLGLINFVLQNILLLSEADFDYIADSLTRFIGPGAVTHIDIAISRFGFNRFDYPVKLVENLIYELSLKINNLENRMLFKKHCHRFLASKYSIKEALGPFDPSIVKKILVVEDSPTARKVIRMNLQNNGFLVVESDNGIEALSKLSTEQPDLVILDVMLPKLDGYSILYMIRHNNDLKKTPVIMLTSKTSLRDKVKGKFSSANAYLTKPFDPDNLISTVEKHIK
ncbi:MAG: response regulator [Desulfobacteraceae bacterium]|nr:response regulator [Desulfobacteraceae bacterium]